MKRSNQILGVIAMVCVGFLVSSTDMQNIQNNDYSPLKTIKT